MQDILLTRKAFLQSAAALAIGPYSQRKVARDHFQFTHFTDVHIEPERGAPLGFAQCIRHIKNQPVQSDFAVCGGDLIFDGIQVTDARADGLYNLYSGTSALLGLPIHHVIGNHDLHGQGLDGPASRDFDAFATKATFLKHTKLKSTHYSFDHKGWHFVFLDNIEPMPGTEWRAFVSEDQLAWLRNDFKACPRKMPIVVVAHVPFVSLFANLARGIIKKSPDKITVVNAEEVIDIFRTRNVRAVLQGHSHLYEEYEHYGIPFYTCGSVCGEWWRGWRMHLFPEGYTVCSCGPTDKFVLQYTSYNWDASKYLNQ